MPAVLPWQYGPTYHHIFIYYGLYTRTVRRVFKIYIEKVKELGIILVIIRSDYSIKTILITLVYILLTTTIK